MKSIFELNTKGADGLISTNQSGSDVFYDQIQALRNLSDTQNGVDTPDSNAFPNGVISYRWSYGADSWWIPSQSYLVIDCTLEGYNNQQLSIADNIAPNMGMASCLFQKMQYKWGDKTVSEISEYVPQVSAFKHRLSKTGNWLNTTGQQINFWKSDFESRQADVVSDGIEEGGLSYRNLGTPLDWSGITNFDAADTLAFDYDNGNAGESAIIYTDTAVASRVLFRTGGVATGDLDNGFVASGIDVGKYIKIQLRRDAATADSAVREYIVKVLRIETAGAADADGNTNNRIIVSRPVATEPDIAAQAFADPSWNFMFNIQVLQDVKLARQVKNFQLIYRPDLSIFQVQHAIPGLSNHELEITPYTNTVYQKNVIESLLADKSSTANFKFRINSMFLQLARCRGPRIDDVAFTLDLDEVRCYRNDIETNNASQKAYDVNPATYALAVAFQDSAADTSTLYSQTKFKIRNSEELNLTRFYVRYAGQQKWQPDAELDFDTADATDKLVELYSRNLLYSGGYYDSQAELLEEFRERGIYIYLPWPRTSSDRSTRVNVLTQFSAGFTVNPKLLLFSRYRKAVLCKIENGALTELYPRDI